MKKVVLLLVSAMVALGAAAQKAEDFISVDDIFRIVTSRYITYANEESDAAYVEATYDAIISAYGYVHELPGDGYGGPCAIIDGYYKGGRNDVAKAMFVPEDEMASVIFISACNMGDESDYGYPEVTVTFYDDNAVAAMMAQLVEEGFEMFDFDNPEAVGDTILLYKGDRQVRVAETETGYLFQFSIAQ